VLSLLRGEEQISADRSTRDFVHVRDAARACLAVASVVEREARHVDFTFRSGWEFTESALTALAAEVYSGRTPEVTVETPDNPLGWKPETPLVEALAETICWYRQSVPTPLRVTERKAA
jgi:nucleoside-diphosphate-sugar epimerase